MKSMLKAYNVMQGKTMTMISAKKWLVHFAV